MARLTACILALFLVAHVSCRRQPSAYNSLLNFVLENSNPLLIPKEVLPVTVVFQTGVIAILDVDRERNTIDVTRWACARFQTDLKWNTSDYNGIASINVPFESIWKPNPHFANDLSVKEYVMSPIAKVMANGIHIIYGRIRSIVSCDNLAENSCTLKLTAWGLNQDMVHVIARDENVHYLNKILASEKTDLTGYEIVSEKYKTYDVKVVPSLPDKVDITEYTFTFKEKNPDRKRGSFKAFFKWN